MSPKLDTGLLPWVNIFRIIPEFRILTLTVCGKSALKMLYSKIIIALIFSTNYLKITNL